MKKVNKVRSKAFLFLQPNLWLNVNFAYKMDKSKLFGNQRQISSTLMHHVQEVVPQQYIRYGSHPNAQIGRNTSSLSTIVSLVSFRTWVWNPPNCSNYVRQREWGLNLVGRQIKAGKSQVRKNLQAPKAACKMLVKLTPNGKKTSRVEFKQDVRNCATILLKQEV